MNPPKIINILFAVFILFAPGCSADSKQYKPVVKGVADLSDGRVNNAIIELNGQWEFYPGRFLSPSEFGSESNTDKVYLDVPGDWSSVQGAKGHGTYRIKVILPHNYTHYSIKLMWVKSSAKLWVDNQLLINQGNVAELETLSVPGNYININDFIPEKNIIDITVHVSNFQDRRGGLCFPLTIAPPDLMYNGEMKSSFVTGFIIGALIIVVLFHLALFLFFRSFSLNLYITLVCCMVLTRLFVLADSIYIASLVSSLGHNFLVKIEFTGLILIFIFLMQFFTKLYQAHSKKIIKRVLYWCGIISVCYIIIVPVYYIKIALPLFQLYVLAVTLFIIISPLREGVRNGASGARIYFSIMILGVLVFINDIAYFLISRGLPNISGYIFFLFLVGHFVVVSIYFSDVFRKNIYLKEEIDLKQRIVKSLNLISSTDSLTGLFNRRFFDSYLSGKIKEYKPGESLWLVMLDIDFFKKVNDELGHNSGDIVLKEMSALIKGLIRTGDVLCRWGGEEFAVIVSGMDNFSIRFFAERIRESVESYRFSAGRDITASLGVVEYIAGESAGDFVHRADIALYGAKNSGRNRVVFA
jgi:diguanylate cyclase (GGDEF)-like protein